MKEKRAWVKELSAKQADNLMRVQAMRKERGIPPWWKTTNENTRRDLNGLSAEYYLQKVEAALAVEGAPVKLLLEIKTKCLTHRLGMDKIRNATRQDPKGRDKLEQLFKEIETLVNDLDNSFGFDLFDESTWKKS